MFPLKDEAKRIRPPVFTILIILTNIFVYVYYMMQPENRAIFIKQFAFFPVDFLKFFMAPSTETGVQFTPDIFTSMFMHGSWMHLLGNCWFLWIFGDNVEGVIGHIKYLIFYLMCGIAASLTHAFIATDPNIPVIGASGAIAGVMGAYLILFPRSRILTFVPLFLIWFIKIPAFIFLIIWFGGQIINGLVISTSKNVSSIAFWAHIGGFVAGMLGGIFYRPKKNRLYSKSIEIE